MLVFFSISPLGESESVSSAVAPIVELIAASGLDYQLTSMGTIFEGKPDQVFDLLKKCHAKMKESNHRVTSKILIDAKAGSNLLYLPLDKIIQMSAASALPEGQAAMPSTRATEPPPPPDTGARSRDALRGRERGERP